MSELFAIKLSCASILYDIVDLATDSDSKFNFLLIDIYVR